MNIDMGLFSRIATIHELRKGANIIGQLIQNDGGQFILDGEVTSSMNWSKTLKSLKAKSGAKLTWPKLFEILGKQDKETPLSTAFVAYSLRQLFGLFSQANIVFCESASIAWHDDKGFSPKLFDAWIKEHKFVCQVTNRQGEVVSEFVPDGATMAHLMRAAESFAKIAGYHSDKSAADNELLPADVLESFQV